MPENAKLSSTKTNNKTPARVVTFIQSKKERKSIETSENEECDQYVLCSIEFILDNASVVNICNDHRIFVKLNSIPMHLSWFRSGMQAEAKNGITNITFENCKNDELNDLSCECIYDEQAKVNLLSQHNMIEDFDLKFRISEDNQICWLENENMCIEFHKN